MKYYMKQILFLRISNNSTILCIRQIQFSITLDKLYLMLPIAK